MASDKDEIDQIMSEIEELQQEMTAKASAEAVKSAPTTSEDDRSLNEFVTVENEGLPAETQVSMTDSSESVESVSASHAENSLETTGSSEGSEDQEPWVEETIAELKRGERQSSLPSSQSGRVTLGVTSGVAVCLKQEMTGQEIVVEFESDCLRITTSDGAELKLPLLSHSQSLRRVA